MGPVALSRKRNVAKLDVAGLSAEVGGRMVATLLPMHPLIETHRVELLALARRRGVTGVRVFGSMSRGDGSDNSDVDLLVTLAPGTSALALGASC